MLTVFVIPVFAVLLHPAARVGWTAWTVHWSTVAGLGALAALYFWRLRRTAKPHDDNHVAEPTRPQSVRTTLFAAALAVIFLSLNGPLHDLSDYYLFSAHMVQHLLLTLVMPPLLISGTPAWMLRPLLGSPALFGLARLATRPAFCFAIFNVVLAAWHVPALYNAAMANHAIHIVQHLMLMGAAVLMWWPLLSPLPELPRLAYPGQMLYCFLMVIPMSIVSIYIALADRILYPAYSSAPRLWGLSPMADQHIGGLIMWIPGGIFFYVVMTFVFFQWSARDTDTTEGAQLRA